MFTSSIIVTLGQWLGIEEEHLKHGMLSDLFAAGDSFQICSNETMLNYSCAGVTAAVIVLF